MNIFCVGQNYAKHAKELGNAVPKEPIFFQKASSCLSTKNVIKLPKEKVIHHEIELVMIFGKGGLNISKKSGLKHLSHWCLGLDLTDRSRQFKMRQKGLPWFDSKSFPGSAVISKSEAFNWKSIEKDFWLLKNGEEVQRGNVKNLIFDIPTLVSELSHIITFKKGDLMFTGTPSGVGPICEGDELQLVTNNRILGTFDVISS